MAKRKYLLEFCLLVFLLSFLAGCGRKTMVVPPEHPLPAAIKDLRFVFTDNGVRLSWSYPQKTVEGADLTEQVAGFELLRAEVPAMKYCAECPQLFVRLARIPGDSGIAAGKVQDVTFDDLNLRPDYHYTYKVRVSAGWWGDSGDSNIIDFVWEGPPAARPH